MANKKMLRGKAPLTMWRGAGVPGGHLYRGSILDPRLVDEIDRDRLLDEGFIEWVVADGENWKRAEDTGDGKAGDSVTVGDVAVKDPNEPDNGTVNTPATPTSDVDAEARRAAARQKLVEIGGTPDGRHGQDVWVEYAVNQGMDRAEAEKATKSDLVAALKS